MDRRRFYRVAELSALSGIPHSTLYDSIGRKEIEAITLGRAIYIPAKEVDRLMGPLVDIDKGSETA